MKILFNLLKFIICFIIVTFIIYWFNLDMKLIRRIQPWLTKHYDEMPRDRRL